MLSMNSSKRKTKAKNCGMSLWDDLKTRQFDNLIMSDPGSSIRTRIRNKLLNEYFQYQYANTGLSHFSVSSRERPLRFA